MAMIEVEAFRAVVDAAVTGVPVLGGAMAYSSGSAASRAVGNQDLPSDLALRVNEGLAKGFTWGMPTALIAFIIVL